VQRGGNLVLTDQAINGLVSMGIVPAGSVGNTNVYQPYADFTDFNHPMLKGLRPNARQLAEYTLIGHGIGNTASPMTTVSSTAWSGISGVTVGTSTSGRVSVGEAPFGDGKIRITNGLRMATEANDHRFGLKDFSLTYSGLYILENSMIHDDPELGGPAEGDGQPVRARVPLDATPFVLAMLGIAPLGRLIRRRRSS
jgi:hypothetical protein